jgi:CMP-N,N'-diacetyllegionaminic acid synthase
MSSESGPADPEGARMTEREPSRASPAVLGLVPARGGSKGIPGKNMVRLRGRRLIEYTLEAARASRSLSRVVLSTDDAAIAAIGRQCGVEVPFLRPPELAADDSAMIDVVRHAVSTLEQEEDARFDAIVLLQPTSPLRTATHVDEAVDLLFRTGADTVVSVVAVPHQYNPASVMRVGLRGRLAPFQEGPLVLRRQDKPAVYARNGPAVLVTKRSVVEQGRLYGEDVAPYVMTLRESVDIDDEHDLELAEFYLGKRDCEQQSAATLKAGALRG